MLRQADEVHLRGQLLGGCQLLRGGLFGRTETRRRAPYQVGVVARLTQAQQHPQHVDVIAGCPAHFLFGTGKLSWDPPTIITITIIRIIIINHIIISSGPMLIRNVK
jgi:hypothetical protein